jgi:hypothetical protein
MAMVRFRKSLRKSRSSRSSRAAAWLGPWLALLACPAAFAGTGVWTPIGPPTGGTVASLAVDPNHPQTLYAAPEVGLYRSTDGGNRWTSTFTPSDTLLGFSTIAFGTDGALYGGNGDARRPRRQLDCARQRPARGAGQRRGERPGG